MINRQQAIDLLQNFLKLKSVTPETINATDFIESFFKENHFTIHRLKFSSSDSYEVDNIFATIGSGKPHLCFAGHIDVVPPGDENAWKSPPFGAEIRNNIIYGRGSEDMKGAIIASLVAVINYLEENPSFDGKISFLLTGDEEGQAINGTRKVMEWLEKKKINIDDCIVIEPSNEKEIGDTIKVGRRGSLTCQLKVLGTQGHVAYPTKALNPIPFLITAIGSLHGNIDQGSSNFLPSNLEITSIDVGNNAYNVIPEKAEVIFNIRFNDNWSIESLLKYIHKEFERFLNDKGLIWQVTVLAQADSYLTNESELSNKLSHCISNTKNIKPQITTTGGTSDARFISKYCSVIEFGLVGRSMHQVDEHVPVDEFTELIKIYKEFLSHYYFG
tara:strand:+ start:62528 stop:63688 length:1161 start_codon:yes stop_codon:yes gene_type:complete